MESMLDASIIERVYNDYILGDPNSPATLRDLESLHVQIADLHAISSIMIDTPPTQIRPGMTALRLPTLSLPNF
jgi:hypothetical protein